MTQCGRVLAPLIVAATMTACGSDGDPASGPGPLGDSVLVWITLRELPPTLTFNQAHVPMSGSEYSWGIVFDTDGDGAFDIEVSLTHFKFSGTPQDMSLIDGTQHTVWEVFDTLGSIHGIARHHDVVARIDPTAPTTVVLAMPRSWPEIARIDEQDRFYVRATYYDPTPPSSFDFTTATAGNGVVTDPPNDVGYGFVDVVSARWDRKP